MHWTDDALILSTKKHGEYDALVQVFSREHGRYAGLVKAALSSKQRGVVQPINLVEATWKARLPEHLGVMALELRKPVASLILNDRLALNGMHAICGLLLALLAERDPHPELYEAAINVIEPMCRGEAWLPHYVRFELLLIGQCGYGLELGQCALTGATHELAYVSPKSGKAANREAGAEYHGKLLALPTFLLDAHATASMADISDGLTLTRYFLEQWVFADYAATMPSARHALAEVIGKHAIFSPAA